MCRCSLTSTCCPTLTTPTPSTLQRSDTRRKITSKHLSLLVFYRTWCVALLMFVSCAGYWRAHPLLGQFGVLRHQRRCGCCSRRFWFEGSLFSKLPCNTREGLLSFCLPIHSEGNYTCQLNNLEFA